MGHSPRGVASLCVCTGSERPKSKRLTTPNRTEPPSVQGAHGALADFSEDDDGKAVSRPLCVLRRGTRGGRAAAAPSMVPGPAAPAPQAPAGNTEPAAPADLPSQSLWGPHAQSALPLIWRRAGRPALTPQRPGSGGAATSSARGASGIAPPKCQLQPRASTHSPCLALTRAWAKPPALPGGSFAGLAPPGPQMDWVLPQGDRAWSQGQKPGGHSLESESSS